MLDSQEFVFTEEQYLAADYATDWKCEFRNGQILPMAYETPRHNELVANTACQLKSQLRDSALQVFMLRMRLKVEANGLQTYTDVFVSRRPLALAANQGETAVDATVIVEVLSPSTATYERGAKFEFYKELPSLRHYLLIEPDRVHVEHHSLDAETGEWQRAEFSSLLDEIRLETIDCVLSVSELYERVEFERNEAN